MELKNTLVIDISPKYDGRFELWVRVNPKTLYVPSAEVNNLYTAMEGYSRDFKQEYDGVLFQLDSSKNLTDNPIIFHILVKVDGKFFLYTVDDRMRDSGYITNILVDNLYTTMEGLSRRYKDVGDFAFQIATGYI